MPQASFHHVDTLDIHIEWILFGKQFVHFFSCQTLFGGASGSCWARSGRADLILLVTALLAFVAAFSMLS